MQKYTEEERVYNPDGTFKMFPRGSFIYRLAGRDRERSAPYYTPEVLTRCLVKYALKELLKEKSANDILGITVCEPAMGSAAFLNETVNQLAEAYLDRKQRETGRRISHDDYAGELQRVKMSLADNNVFGVDLTPGGGRIGGSFVIFKQYRTIIDDTLPGGPFEKTILYHAPFDRCNREEDYDRAWKKWARLAQP